MDENVNDQDVLLVKEKGNEKLQVVTGMDDKGNLRTAPPKQENEQDLLKIDIHLHVSQTRICPRTPTTEKKHIYLNS